MECERCGNVSRRYFALYRGKSVCRRCIGYTGDEASIEINTQSVSATIPFQLTSDQKKASMTICSAIQNKDVLVNAVCGANG